LETRRAERTENLAESQEGREMSEAYTDHRLYMTDAEMRQFYASEDAKVQAVSMSHDQWNTEEDPVEHPAHYCKGGIECIDAIRASMSKDAFAGYCKGNLMKYVWRYEHKGKRVEDLKKAQVYLGWLIETEEKKA
jgi:hypothetical protein